MVQTFIKGGQFHRWLQRPDCPSTLVTCKELFERIFRRQSFEQPFSNSPKGVNKEFPEDFGSITKESSMPIIEPTMLCLPRLLLMLGIVLFCSILVMTIASNIYLHLSSTFSKSKLKSNLLSSGTWPRLSGRILLQNIPIFQWNSIHPGWRTPWRWLKLTGFLVILPAMKCQAKISWCSHCHGSEFFFLVVYSQSHGAMGRGWACTWLSPHRKWVTVVLTRGN